jgi:hypothetical protein
VAVAVVVVAKVTKGRQAATVAVAAMVGVS